MGRFSVWRVNVFMGHEQRSRRFSSDVRGQVSTPLQFQVAQACCLLWPAPDGVVSSQRMYLSTILLVKGPIRQGYQAAGHLHSRMRLGNALRRLFAA